MSEDKSPADKAITSWRITGLALISISVGFYLYVQGAHVSASGFINEKTTTYSAAVYGLLVLIPLSAYYYAYTYHVVKFISNKDPKLVFPLLHELHLPKNSSFVKKARIISMIIFFAVPMFSLVHCYKKSLGATIYINESCANNVCSEIWSSNAIESLTKFSEFSEIFTDGNKYRLDGQITYFPGWQPWIELVLLAWVFLLWAKALYVFIKMPNGKA